MRTGHREAVETALSDDLAGLMQRYADRRLSSTYAKDLLVTVDRERPRSGAWYELFPRSTGPQAGRHGTFRDLEARLSYIAFMGLSIAAR